MRPPATTLAVDAAILIAAARGRSSGALITASQHARLVTTDRAVAEARRRIALGMKRPELLPVVDSLALNMTVAPVNALQPFLPLAADALRDAVASRNGATDDAHLLALAWAADADIWSSDSDFAGTGVASWSTPNLMRALAWAV